MLQMKQATGLADTQAARAAPTICPVVDDTQHRPQHMTAANLEISMKLRNILISTAIAALGVSAWAQGTPTDMTAKPAAPVVAGAPTLKAPAAAMPAAAMPAAAMPAAAMPAAAKPEKMAAVKKVSHKKLHKASHKPMAKKATTGTAQ
jgi:hypothetical protein